MHIFYPVVKVEYLISPAMASKVIITRTIASFAVAYHHISFVSNVVCRTVVSYTRLKPNGKFRMGLKGIERIECITLFTEVASQLSGNLHLFFLNSEQSSGKIIIIRNVTAKNYLKETSSSILCFIIQGKGSSWKRFDPEICFGNLTRLSFLSSRT